MKYQNEINRAYQMGRAAAKDGRRYDINYTAELIPLSNISYQTPEERHECVFHMRNAWRKGYEDECRLFVPLAPVTEPSIVLQHPRVRSNADEIDAYVY